MSKILEKKEDMMCLKFDKAFHIMYANEKHLEILTVLLSKVLKIDYKLLEGNVSLLQRKSTNEKVSEKECEKDVVVSVKTDKDYRIVIEVNVKTGLFKTVLDRNMYYMFQEGGHALKKGMKYEKIPYTVLINFNKFFVNNKQKDIIEEFHYRDKYGYILTEKSVNYNINIEECYNLWYNNDYQGKFEPYEEDLMLLCAAMMVDNQNDFHNIVSMVRMKPEIKELMEGLVRKMNNDEKLVTEYRTWKEEEELINKAIINEVREDSFNAGVEQGIEQTKKEMVFNMYEDNASLELISKYTKLTVDEVKKIINNNKMN